MRIDKGIKTAVVTGGSAGIGLAISQHLLREGYRVLSLSRSCTTWEDANFIQFQVDLSDRESTARAAAKIAEYSPIVLVNNAGVVKSAFLEDVALEDLDYLSDLYLGSSIVLAKACLPSMKQSGRGRGRKRDVTGRCVGLVGRRGSVTEQ